MKRACGARAPKKDWQAVRVCEHATPLTQQVGDIVVLDFDAARAKGDAGEPILGAKRAGLRLDTETADRDFVPGDHLQSRVQLWSAGAEFCSDL